MTFIKSILLSRFSGDKVSNLSFIKNITEDENRELYIKIGES